MNHIFEIKARLKFKFKGRKQLRKKKMNPPPEVRFSENSKDMMVKYEKELKNAFLL